MQNNITTLDPLLTVKSASKYLCCSERTLWKLTRDGDIPAVKIGRSVRYAKQDIDDFINKNKTKTNF